MTCGLAREWKPGAGNPAKRRCPLAPRRMKPPLNQEAVPDNLGVCLDIAGLMNYMIFSSRTA
jgi:hypothetical protein